jgi:hypothetical protein
MKDVPSSEVHVTLYIAKRYCSDKDEEAETYFRRCFQLDRLQQYFSHGTLYSVHVNRITNVRPEQY